ncbi:hypothetical protein [Rhizobium leguminosarum]
MADVQGTIPNADERAVWLRHVPQLEPVFAAMPTREGRIDVVYSFMPRAVAVMVILTDTSEDEPEWWWHESLYIPSDRAGRLVTALLIAYDEVSRMLGNTEPFKVPMHPAGPNVVPFPPPEGSLRL